jgi:hypothetical protein
VNWSLRRVQARTLSERFICVFSDAVRMKPIIIPKRMRANIARFADAQARPLEDAGGR